MRIGAPPGLYGDMPIPIRVWDSYQYSNLLFQPRWRRGFFFAKPHVLVDSNDCRFVHIRLLDTSPVTNLNRKYITIWEPKKLFAKLSY